VGGLALPRWGNSTGRREANHGPAESDWPWSADPGNGKSSGSCRLSRQKRGERSPLFFFSAPAEQIKGDLHLREMQTSEAKGWSRTKGVRLLQALDRVGLR
jgi:hypothetical protein